MRNPIIEFAKQIIDNNFPRAARFCRSARDRWQFSKEPQDTPFGFKLIGSRTMQRGYFEPEETEIIKKIIPGVDVFINVGANIGYCCCLAIKMGKKVVAFEPMFLNVRCLLKNIEVNNFENEIEIFPIALSNEVGITKIYGDGTGASLLRGWANISERFVTLVPTSTLDRVLGSRFQGKRCFVVVDVEGAEKLTLGGASSFLSFEPKPTWMIEITTRRHQPKGVSVNPNLLSTFQLFWDRGYESWTADRQCRVVQPYEIESIANGGHNTLSSHNFLFIEKGKRAEILRDGWGRK